MINIHTRTKGRSTNGKAYNRKGQAGHWATFFLFLFILIIIGAGIVLGTSAYFGAQYDFRAEDSLLLNYKIKNCINNIDFTIEENFEKYFLDKCNLNEQTIKKDFLINLYVDTSLKYTSGKDGSICKLSEKNKDYPKCTDSVFVKLIDGQNKEVRILTGSNQKSVKRV